jgi:hypothetical protein
MKQNKGLIYLPRTQESVPTPRTRKTAVHITKTPILTKPRNFEQALARLKATGKLDRNDFNSGAELGAFIDFYNSNIEKSRDKYANNEISEISKLLARISTRRVFVGKKP